MNEERVAVAALRAVDLHGAASRWPVDEDGGRILSPDATRRPATTGQALALDEVRAGNPAQRAERGVLQTSGRRRVAPTRWRQES